MKVKIRESEENYLETILILQKRKGNVRSIDIANELDFSRPSVSRAIKLIKEKKYITVEENGLIKLTKEGKELAERVYERHQVIGNMLVKLGVSEKTAYEDACRIEHVISAETFEKIKEHAEKNIM
ncbi:metal-dependent transcriptional regulator [Anaerofustis sp.]|uniref:metal-dependent transcriptional regulator n=1 Tax=Anaerofustis sp. TaxID=1872517 RepID=UPI0025C0C112|nr:metal-dependent transcriptional regulator [Anaerofustis sp.]